MITTLNERLFQLDWEYSELTIKQQEIKHQLHDINKAKKEIRYLVAKHFEKQINQYIIDNNISINIITNTNNESMEKIIIDTENLFVINSQYPGFSFRAKNGYLLSDYYNYNDFKQLEKITNILIDAINNGESMFNFPQSNI